MEQIRPYNHQIKYSKLLYEKLKQYGYGYIAGKPRSGKTYTAILTCELSDKINNVLVLTKKNAISGWLKFIDGNNLKHTYTVTNYEQVSKLKPIYDLVIIDESHNLGALPKPSKRTQEIRKLCWNLPHIHLSGTAIVESPLSIYHQMFISKYNPFKQFKNFYDFFREYGIPKSIFVSGREIKQYKEAKLDKLLPVINKFTIYMTQEDAGIDKEVQAIDEVHYIDLPKNIKAIYNELQKERVIDIKGEQFIADTTMKLRLALHQIEGGTLKLDSKTIVLHRAKIDYIKKNFDLSKKVGIMCHFKGEQELLKSELPECEVYSSNAHAEGVDLSHLDTFIIYSSDYSGAKFIQRRERIINMNGGKTNIVHHLLVKKAISEQVYNTVTKKNDFNNSTYVENYLL